MHLLANLHPPDTIVPHVAAAATLPGTCSRCLPRRPAIQPARTFSRPWQQQPAAPQPPAMAAPGRIPRPGLQQPLPGTVHDLEADSKYTKRRRRGGLGLSPALTARAAAAVAAGIGLALLLLAGFSGLQSCLSRSEAQHPEPLEPGGAAARAVRQQPQLNGRPAEAGSGAPTFAASTAPVAAAAAANCSCEPLHLDPTERQQMAAEVAATLAALPHRPSTASEPDAVAAEARGDVVAPGRAVIVPGVQPVRVVDQAFGPQSNENIPGALGSLPGDPAACRQHVSWSGTSAQVGAHTCAAVLLTCPLPSCYQLHCFLVSCRCGGLACRAEGIQ